MFRSFLQRLKTSKLSTKQASVRPGVEMLESREVMTASPGPQSLLIYYGYPSLINGATTLAQAETTLGAYKDVILGDTLELPTIGDNANTKAIIASAALAHTNVYGYLDAGVATQNNSLATLQTEITEWKSMGVKGIMLDDFGYDFGTSRGRQNSIVDMVHAAGLSVIANAWNPDDAFGKQVSAADNPTGASTHLNSGDIYLSEDYQIVGGSYASVSAWRSKANDLATYQSSIGFQVFATTTATSAANTFNQSQFNYAWYSALLDGYAAVGWGEYDYSSDNNSAPFRARPTVNAGTMYEGSVVANGSVFTQNTNLGQIVVNTATDTGSFNVATVAPPAAPTLTATAVSGTQVNLSWNGVANATSYAVEELSGGVWKPITTLSSTSTSYSATGLSNGTSYTFAVVAGNTGGTAQSNSQTVVTPTTAPAAPTFTLKAVSSTQASLSWNTVANATSYWVEQWTGSVWKQIATLSSTTTGYSVAGLTPGTTYFFSVVAVNAAGSTWANYQTVAMPNPAPAAPIFSAATVSSTQVNLKWNPVAGGTSYWVEQWTGSVWKQVATLGSGVTSYAAAGLTPGTTYFFSVVAVNAAGSTWANYQTALA